MEKILLFTLCFFVLSCSTREKKSKTSFTIIPMTNLNFESKLKMSEFVESIEAIPLETTPESLIGEINRIIRKNGRYYMFVTSGYTNGRVLVFDDSGKFLLKIDNIGQGKGEYLDPSDFVLTAKSEIKIAAYGKIVTYDSVGNYIRETPIDYYAREINSTPSGNYIMSHFDLKKHHYNALCLIDSTDHITTDFYKMHPNDLGKMWLFIRLNTFADSGNNLYFTYPLCDTIFSVKDEAVTPAYYIDFGAKTIDYSAVQEKDDLNKILDKISKKEYVELLGFQVRPHFLCLEVGNNEDDAFIAFCFKNGNRMVGGGYVVDDMFFKNNYIKLKYKNLPRNMDGDFLLWPLASSVFLNAYNQYKENLSSAEWDLFCRKNRKLIDLCEHLSEEDNPVLLRVKVKK